MAHPDYLAAPVYRRFQGASLMSLWDQLQKDIERVQPTTPIYKVLPSGACVALWREQNGLRVLRISRREKPKTAAGPQKWAQEIDTFAEKFGVQGWARRDDLSAPGIAVLLYEPQVLL
jgi:hypothetical protein